MSWGGIIGPWSGKRKLLEIANDSVRLRTAWYCPGYVVTSVPGPATTRENPISAFSSNSGLINKEEWRIAWLHLPQSASWRTNFSNLAVSSRSTKIQSFSPHIVRLKDRNLASSQ